MHFLGLRHAAIERLLIGSERSVEAPACGVAGARGCTSCPADPASARAAARRLLPLRRDDRAFEQRVAQQFAMSALAVIGVVGRGIFTALQRYGRTDAGDLVRVARRCAPLATCSHTAARIPAPASPRRSPAPSPLRHHLHPGVAIPEEIERGVHRPAHAAGIEIIEHDACARARAWSHICTESASPPVRRTIGTVPYLRLYIWLRPQGSYSDGIRNMSLGRFDQVRELFAVAAMEYDAIRKAALQVREELFVTRIRRCQVLPGSGRGSRGSPAGRRTADRNPSARSCARRCPSAACRAATGRLSQSSKERLVAALPARSFG